MTLTEAQALLDTLAAETGAEHVAISRSRISSGRIIYTFSMHKAGFVSTGHAESLEMARDIALGSEPFDARKALEEAA